MTAVLITGPAAEPVSLDEAKAHLRVDNTDEDLLIASLITTARLHLEVETRRVFMTQTWSLVFDDWPDARFVELFVAPLQSIDSVTVFDDADTATLIDPALYFASLDTLPPRLVLRGSGSWPHPGRSANGIDIRVTAGYGPAPADVPQPLRQAILLAVAHWFEHRELVVFGSSSVPVPQSVAALVQPYRQVRL